jgi:hypothetical protein
MGTVSDDRGPEEIPVLVELEVQQWVDEALRNTARATEHILDRVASMGVPARTKPAKRLATSIWRTAKRRRP